MGLEAELFNHVPTWEKEKRGREKEKGNKGKGDQTDDTDASRKGSVFKTFFIFMIIFFSFYFILSTK